MDEMNSKGAVCSICHKRCNGFSMNARPVTKGVCCKSCHTNYVAPIREYFGKYCNCDDYNEYLVAIVYDSEYLYDEVFDDEDYDDVIDDYNNDETHPVF